MRQEPYIDPSALAWLAGWLEGEGSFTGVTTKSGSCATRVTGTSTDRDVLECAQRIAGGRISASIKRDGRKPIYQWVVASRREAVALMRALHPQMGMRRQEQIDAAISHDDLFRLNNRVAICGTRSKYTAGCRCRLCRAACARDARERRAA